MHTYDVWVFLRAIDVEKIQVIVGSIDVCQDWIDEVGAELICVVFPRWIFDGFSNVWLTPVSRLRSCLV